jgi:glycerol-3-phosphate dehydrogenase
VTQRLCGGAEYFDAQMDDARLCLEVIQTAAHHGAHAANYVEAVAFEYSGGQIASVQAVDHVAGNELLIRARQVLNAAGAAVDALCRLAGDMNEPHLQPTKGVHVVAPPKGLKAALLLLHPADGRVFFVIPWMGLRPPGGLHSVSERSKTLIGTTDTYFQDGKDTLEVTPEEIEYLLAGYNHYFKPPLTPTDLLGSFAGVRPLIRSRLGDPSARSREFRIFDSPSGLLSVAGGKYTTYRRMAETIAEAVARRLKRWHRKGTANLRLDGAPDVAWERFEPAAVAELTRSSGLSAESARHLVQRYGRRAPDVAAYLTHDPGLAKPVLAGEPDLRVEFPYQRDHEMAVYPADFLLRRTRLGLFHPDLLRNPPLGIK